MIQAARTAPPKLLSKNEQEQQQLSLVLPNPNISVSKSMNFMKHLTVASISSIAFLREIFPAENFAEKRLNGQKVWILQGSEEVPETRVIVQWIREAFELVHSYHLQKMILVINKGCDTLEIYTFSFVYNFETIRCEVVGNMGGEKIADQRESLPEDIGKSVQQLIRCILVRTSTLQPLPDSYELSMRLYLDEDTPQDIIPDCFNPSKLELNFPAEAETLKLGKIKSKFTTYTVSSKSVMDGTCTFGGDEEEEVASQDEDYVPSSQQESVVSLISLASSAKISQTQLTGTINGKAAETDSNRTNLSEKLSIVSLREVVRCICECSDALDNMLHCSSCKTHQHKACYKFLEDASVSSHICVNCHDPEQGRSCSVPELLSDPCKKESAFYRQALQYCCTNPQISTKRIMTHLKASRPIAERIMQQLEEDGCFQLQKTKGQVRNVAPDFKNTVMGRYFNLPATIVEPMEDDAEASTEEAKTHGTKRQLSEEKENTPPAPGPKRRKVLRTKINVKKSARV